MSENVTTQAGSRRIAGRSVWDTEKPSLRDRLTTIAQAAAIPTTLVGLYVLGAAGENALGYRPPANEIYTGSITIDLKEAEGRTYAGVPGKDFIPNTVDESTLTVNGQSLEGVHQIRVAHPEVTLLNIAPDKGNPLQPRLAIHIPFDGGVELYYLYDGPNGIRLEGGNFQKGSETPDGGFKTVQGETIPPSEVGQVEVLPNEP